MADTIHLAHDLELIFKRCFDDKFNTLLVGGANEPLYQPASVDHSFNTIFYREDFFSSALHEVAHWCIASDKRRQLTDFGYWYDGDSRDTMQQAKFQSVELVPQAIELLFSRACRYSFQVSIDNFCVELIEINRFESQVEEKANQLEPINLPRRANIFLTALRSCYQSEV